MLSPKRKYHKLVAAIIVILLFVAGLSHLRVQSVDQYKQEQKKLAKDILLGELSVTSGEAAGDPYVAEAGQSAVETPGIPESTGKNTNEPKANSPSPVLSGSAKPSEKGQQSGIKGATGEKTAEPKASSKDSASKSQTKTPAIPSPTDRRLPVKTSKPTETENNSKELVCYLSIRCDSLQKHMDRVDDSMKKYIPSDGKILSQTAVKMKTGDTAYTILEKVCKAKNIALDAEYSNAFSSQYVRGIGHLYEKQAGDMSGWLYLVNGKLPGWGASRYKLKEGDQVEWVYTCTGNLE